MRKKWYGVQREEQAEDIEQVRREELIGSTCTGGRARRICSAWRGGRAGAQARVAPWDYFFLVRSPRRLFLFWQIQMQCKCCIWVRAYVDYDYVDYRDFFVRTNTRVFIFLCIHLT